MSKNFESSKNFCKNYFVQQKFPANRCIKSVVSYVYCHLLAIDPPTITEGPGQVQVIAGDDAFLPCVADGNPLAVITWETGTGDVITVPHIVSDDGLTLFDITQNEHAFGYRCVATNLYGNQLSQGNLVIFGTIIIIFNNNT